MDTNTSVEDKSTVDTEGEATTTTETSAVVVSTEPTEKTVDESEQSKPVQDDGVKSGESITGSAPDTFVVHIDESDTNLDYDITGDSKAEERDAPTPTKDESMDVDAVDIVQTSGNTTSEKPLEKEVADPSLASSQMTKRLVFHPVASL